MLAGLQGSGKTTLAGKLGYWLQGPGPHPAARRRRPPAPQRRHPARGRRRAGRRAGVRAGARQRRRPRRGARRPERAPGRSATRSRCRAPGSRRRASRQHDVVIVDTAGRLAIDENAHAAGRRHPRGDPARRGAVRHRRDDRPGGGRDRAGVPGGRRLHRRRPDQARRRRPRWRGAVGGLGDRPADHVRLTGEEREGLRGLPPRPDGRAHPRHGRRAHPHRAGREGVRPQPGRRDGAQVPRGGGLHLRRLPPADVGHQEDGLAEVDARDDAGHGADARPARRPRRARVRPRRGDGPLDDARSSAPTPSRSTARAGPASPRAPGSPSPRSTSCSSGSARPRR